VAPIVECLRCGEQHRLTRSSLHRIVDAECPRCGYLGWAYQGELSETSRRALQDPRTSDLVALSH
jgi:Zn ribbon nucleic-acid-binding protein